MAQDFTTKPNPIHNHPDAVEHTYAREKSPELNPMAELLRLGQYEAFNQQVASNGPADLSYSQLRMLDLTQVNLEGATMEGAYLRGADLRGQDLSSCCLDGTSLAQAKISGVLFPEALSAAEIQMSITHGTRIRLRHPER